MRTRRDERMLRPFWLHQVAEYLIGLVVVAQGLQSPTPIVPTVAGGLIVANAAVVEGPLGAFRLVPRRVHRYLDVVVVAALLAGAALPVLGVDATSRLLLGAVAVVLGFVWWNSSFERPAPRARDADPADAIGRFAGRAVGGAVRAIRDRRGP